jgi:colicin import membrane protein
MDSNALSLRAITYSVLVHLACLAVAVLGLLWTSSAETLSVAGPMIEATLVDFNAAALPASKSAPRPPVAPKPKPKPAVKPAVKPAMPPALTEPPPTPPRGEDRANQALVRIRPDALETAEKPQDQRIKREQVDLTEPENELVKMERERQQQLDDIRHQREQAEKNRQLEEQKLAQLQNQNRQSELDQQRDREQQRLQQLAAEAAQRAGNEGVDDSLLAHYKLAMQNQIVPQWLRPDTVAAVRCKVRIVQIVGGEVLSATVLSPCQADEVTKRSMEAAVLRAQPLPYRGFESVFQRQIDFNFCYPESLCTQP